MIRTENINQIWASLLVEECLRKGADTFFLAPGSRCTPLTLAVARHPDARSVCHFDERGLGFAALGFARATGRPGVVICTSGTAVSNLTPAVVEAHMDAVPLLLLTADRPFELRDCGANQAVPQVRAFDPYLSWSTDLSSPDVAISPTAVLTTLDQAVDATRTGPVQVNCPFREPLAPSPDRTDAEAYLIPLTEWSKGCDPYTLHVPEVRQTDEVALVELEEVLPVRGKVLVIVGGGCTESEAMAIEQMAEAHAWPIVSDVTSGLHFGPRRQRVVRHVDALTGPAGFADDLRPDHVLQFGCRFLSKPLLQALEVTSTLSWVQVVSRAGRFDPLHRVTHRIVSDIDRFCLQWRSSSEPDDETWLQNWLQADRQVEAVYAEELDDRDDVTEPGVARTVTRLISNLHGLVLGASMPVRDVNQFAALNRNHIHVAANRGASGIDGTLATAAGFAQGLHQCVTVLLGDLAALHDLNSLALVAESRAPVIVVVINNHGGGIFHFLPVAEEEDEFETFFGTPHEWDFEAAAAQFDLPYARLKTMEEFEEGYQEAMDTGISCVIEVETDRKDNLILHRQLAAMLDLPVS